MFGVTIVLFVLLIIEYVQIYVSNKSCSKSYGMLEAFMISSVLVIFCFADSKQCLMTDFTENLLHSAERSISPSFLFPSPLLDIPPFFRNVEPLYPLLLIPTMRNSLFSGRLKTDNIKPCKPITYRNCVSWPYSGWVFSGLLTDMGGGGGKKPLKSVTYTLQWWSLVQLYLT